MRYGHADQRIRIGDRRLDGRFGGRGHILGQKRQGGGPRNRRLAFIQNQLIELTFRINGAGPASMQRRTVMRRSLAAIWIPFCDRFGCPFCRAAGMALVACVRCTDRHRQVGSRDAHAVIAAVVHHHIILGWHVAADALRPGATRRMFMMRGDIELFRQMALGAQGVALGAQLCGVRFMAVGTDNASQASQEIIDGEFSEAAE